MLEKYIYNLCAAGLCFYQEGVQQFILSFMKCLALERIALFMII